MPTVGTPENPLRVAVVGSGPAAFYVAEDLQKRLGEGASIDMFERLPAPHGLVRYGVAPDHQKIKNVTKVFDRVAAKPGFRFFGNVCYGTHLSLQDLERHYHALCFATGAQTDRRLGIPGEDLEGSHPATEFVAWYNGHPDFIRSTFDLTCKRVVVVGVGNVAVDVARILCRTNDELDRTDAADHALRALRSSRVEEVVMLGRRGVAQAAFTNPELRELGEMEGASLHVRAEEIELDEFTLARSSDELPKDLRTKLEILERCTGAPAPTGKRRLTIRFLASPVELVPDDSGRVEAVRVVKNRLESSPEGWIKAVPTGETETIPAGLVFRSVGYRGVSLPGLPFDESRGVVPNDAGRVTDASGTPIPGLYVSGWIKRGPSGVIGTNKPDAKETVASLAEDLDAGKLPTPASPDPADVHELVTSRAGRFVSFEDWQRIDAHETEAGRAAGRPRVKVLSADEAFAALDGG